MYSRSHWQDFYADSIFNTAWTSLSSHCVPNYKNIHIIRVILLLYFSKYLYTFSLIRAFNNLIKYVLHQSPNILRT